VLSAFLEKPEGSEAFVAWAKSHHERFEAIVALLEASVSPSPLQLDPVRIAEALAALQEVDGRLISAIASLLKHTADDEGKLAIVEALHSDAAGRRAVRVVTGLQIADRIADTRKIAGEYMEKLEKSTTGETDIQSFIKQHPWLLGLEYTRVRSHPTIPRGQLDFLLERYDGFHDLLELKDPQDPIVEGPEVMEGEPPPPASAYRFSKAVAQGLAQAHLYRATMIHNERTIEQEHGIKNSRDPWLFIVVGRLDALDTRKRLALAELNRSLHRVQIIPFDALSRRIEVLLSRLEGHLTAASQ